MVTSPVSFLGSVRKKCKPQFPHLAGPNTTLNLVGEQHDRPRLKLPVQTRVQPIAYPGTHVDDQPPGQLRRPFASGRQDQLVNNQLRLIRVVWF